jgi:tetratricopeptide (TPR) repeat protein
MAEELAPENISLLLQTGESFATMKQYDEAFARFYKVEYLKPSSRRALRAIAWCSFITGKDEQARSYYGRLHEMPSPSFEDYLNAGHVEWVTKNNAKAIEYYNKAKETCSNPNLVAEHIIKDKEILKARGINEKELLLLRDIIL